MPAPYISDPHLTPSSSYYGFIHWEDNGRNRVRIYGLLGLDAFGDPVNVDESSPPYDGSHILASALPTDNPHGAVIGDSEVPMIDGVPAYAPVWRYLVGTGD